MSLRQLKFKPKLQLNTAAKNKTDDNSRPTVKIACNNKNVTGTSDSNQTVAQVLLVQAVHGDKTTSEDSTGLKDHVSSNTSEASNTINNVCESVRPPPENVSDCNGDKTNSKNNNNVTPFIPKAKLPENGSISNPDKTCLSLHRLDDSSSSRTELVCLPQQKSIEQLDIQRDINSDDVDSSTVGNANIKNKSLINLDVLKKISSLGSQQINSQNHDRLNVVDKESKEVLLSDGRKTTLNESLTSSTDIKSSEKNIGLTCETDATSRVKVSDVLNKENLESSKINKQAICSTKNNYSSKTTKRKKSEGKNSDTSPSKLSNHQRTNFKPNVAALGKIRRPEKFATSSYSKMESLAKEQFMKKFGKQQEPDASKLTMMDLIFYNPSTNPMPQCSDKKLLNTLNNSANAEKNEEKSRDGFPEVNNSDEIDENIDDELPVPQLKISADGKVIVAQESLVIKPSKTLESCNFETVIDSDLKKRKPVRNLNRCGWSHLDTIKFYKALNSLGCDFETMQSLFPERSRRNLKSKFKKEEKLHGSLINKVLSHHSEFDLSNVVRELEIDTVYNDTIKTYGRGFTETEKRSKGRKKSLSSVVAGKSSRKNDGDESDDSIIDEEFGKKRKKVDLGVISKMSEVLGLNNENESPALEADNKLSNSESSDTCTSAKETLTTKRKRKKYVESDSDSESDVEPCIADIVAQKNSENLRLRRTPRIIMKRKTNSSPERLQSKSIVLNLEDLIDFNDGTVKEPQPNTHTEIINDNHIVINTNIEFDNVKYTRYISYNSNNLENPIEINETVAHVD